MTEEEVKIMRELFSMCDEDKGKVENCSKLEDGVVTKAQLWNLMQKLDLAIEKEEYENFWSDLDKKSDGKLTFDEFLLGLRWIQKVCFYK